MFLLKKKQEKEIVFIQCDYCPDKVESRFVQYNWLDKKIMCVYCMLDGYNKL
jgi:hypothetical protein